MIWYINLIIFSADIKDCHILCSSCFFEKAVSAYAFPIDWLQIIMQLINCNTNKNSEISPHPTIVNDIPLYSHNFYRSLYDVVCDVFFIIQTQVCIFLDALFTGTSFEALARQENIYSGTVNTDMLWCLYYCIWVSVLSGCPYQVSSLEKGQRHMIYSVGCLWHSHGKNPVRLYPKLQSQPIGLRKIFIDYLFSQADQSDCTKSVSISSRFASSEELQNVPCQICGARVFPLVV